MTSSNRARSRRRNVAEHRHRDRIDLADREVGVDEIDAERRLVQQRLMLLAAIAQGLLGLARAARASSSCDATRASSSRALNGLTR